MAVLFAVSEVPVRDGTRTRGRLSNSIANVTQEIYSGKVYLTG